MESRRSTNVWNNKITSSDHAETKSIASTKQQTVFLPRDAMQRVVCATAMYRPSAYRRLHIEATKEAVIL